MSSLGLPDVSEKLRSTHNRRAQKRWGLYGRASRLWPSAAGTSASLRLRAQAHSRPSTSTVHTPA